MHSGSLLFVESRLTIHQAGYEFIIARFGETFAVQFPSQGAVVPNDNYPVGAGLFNP